MRQPAHPRRLLFRAFTYTLIRTELREHAANTRVSPPTYVDPTNEPWRFIMQAATFAGAMTVPEFIDEPSTFREAFPARRPGCDPRVPYERLEDAIAKAWAAYPHASNIVGLWTPASSSDVCVEVWANDRARVIPAHRIANA